MEFRKQTLDNGLEIVAECNDDAHSLGLGFFVRTGSRDENDDVAGVSHFLEHMVFKGTPQRTADDVNREFDEMGAHYNAFTSEENTVYYASVLPECQPRCLALVADILRPSLREEDFDTEKKVIIEEIHMYQDQPPFGGDDRCKAIHFGAHPLARSVLGTVESITDLSARQMRDYFALRYGPENMVLAASGRVDFSDLVDDARRLCGDWTNRDAQRDVPRAEPRQGFETMVRETASQEYVLQMMAGPAAGDDDRFAAKLLATIVGDDSGSRFYWDLVDSGLAEQAGLGHYEFQGTGTFMSYMSCDPDQAEENLERMLRIYRDVERDGITADELELARTKVKSRVVLGSERPRNRLFAIGANWTNRGEYCSVQDDLTELDGVSVDAIHAVLTKYALSYATTLAVGPRTEWRGPTGGDPGVAQE